MSSPTSNAIRTPVKPRAKSPSDRKTARQGGFGTVWRRTAPVAMDQPFAYIMTGSVS